MITLCGFSVSNYYNKVKMALLEKAVPFSEELVMTKSKDPAVLAATPLGKIPFMKTPQGPISESQACLDYLEAAYPSPSLMPADPYAQAKVRELTTYIDWHLEICVRQLYGAAFFGAAPLGEEEKASIRKQVEKHIQAFKKLAQFSPYVAGATFTQADCSAFNNLPLVGMATKLTYGEDLLLTAGVNYKDYIKLVGERASAQKVVADRKAGTTKI
jgi:glutathione S-transferase